MTGDPGLGDVLAALLPLGLVGAFSWLPVTGVVVLLLTPGGRRRAVVFLAGRLVGLAVITVAFVAGARAVPAVPELEGRLVGSTEALVGLALVGFGLLTWHARHRHHRQTTPHWLLRMTEASGPAVFAASLVVDLQPKGLLLGLASGAVVRSGSLPVPQAVVAVLCYLVVAGSSVLLPVLATVLAPARTGRWLRAGQDWLTAHGAVVTAVVLVAVGVVVVVDGLRRF